MEQQIITKVEEVLNLYCTIEDGRVYVDLDDEERTISLGTVEEVAEMYTQDILDRYTAQR